MKLYIKEFTILLLQILTFYILPLFAGPTDIMGLVVLMLLITMLLSIIIGIISNNKIKFLYPFIISIIFIPSIFIYYNDSALVHSLWYLVVSIIGLVIGIIINKLININKESK